MLVASPPPQLQENHSELAATILPPDDGLLTLDAAILSADHARRFATGAVLDHLAPDAQPTRARVYSEAGSFIAVASLDEHGSLRPERA